MKAYFFKDWVFQLNNQVLSGFAGGDDTFKIERMTDQVETEVGTDGFMEASVSADQRGHLVVKIQHTSDMNAVFTDFINSQRLSGSSFIPLNGSAQSIHTGESHVLTGGVVTKEPPVGLGAKATAREWEFVFENWTPQGGTTATN